MVRRWIAAAGLIGLVAVMSACEARAEISVNDNGSGSFGFTFVANKQDLATLGGFGGSDKDPFATMKEEIRKGNVDFTVKEFDVGDGGRGIQATVPFNDVAELKGTLGKLNSSGGAAPFAAGSFEDFVLERRGEGWYFKAHSDPDDFGNPGRGGKDGDALPSFDTKALAAFFSVQFRVTLPGSKKTTTADLTESKGNSTIFIWKPNLAKPVAFDLIALTEPANAFPVIPVAAGTGALALIAGFAIVSGKRKAGAAAAAATMAAGTMDYDPGVPAGYPIPPNPVATMPADPAAPMPPDPVAPMPADPAAPMPPDPVATMPADPTWVPPDSESVPADPEWASPDTAEPAPSAPDGIEGDGQIGDEVTDVLDPDAQPYQ